MSEPEPENLYERLAGEQQHKAQRFLIWIVLPVSGVVAVCWLATGGPYRQAVNILVILAVAVLVVGVDTWRKRRD